MARRGRPLSVLAAAAALGVGTVVSGAGAEAGGAAMAGAWLAAVGPVASAVIDARPATPPLPRASRTALARAVDSLGAALGYRLDAAAAIDRAVVPDAVAGRLALLVDGLRRCHDAAAPARAALERFGVTVDGRAVGAARERAMRAAATPIRVCAARLEALALATFAYLRTHPHTAGNGIDLWPALRYSPGASADTYQHDYAVLVDEGGDDVYTNNAGGNVLDLLRGPVGSAAPTKAPARGCATFALEFLKQCQIGVAVLIDPAGDDTYGVREAPAPGADAFCTADPVVGRIATSGSGLAGVGLLVDGAGDDRYVARTVSEGSGHLAGVGVLRDEAGDDSYLALRTSQGYALESGLGMLRDESGDDTYDYYEAAPLDTAAGYQRPGSGGVLDDSGLCDRLPRMLQGTATTAGSVGVLVDAGGSDHYRGAPPSTQVLEPIFPEAAFGVLHHSSQGFGGDKGAGYLLDEDGIDTYTGVPGHGDDTVVDPTPENTGRFEDRDRGSAGGRSSPAAAPRSEPDGLRTAATPLPASVDMKGSAYVPRVLVVPAGNTVTWTNRDAAGHSVTADDASFDSHPGCGSPTGACLEMGQS